VEFHGTNESSPYRFGERVVALDPPIRITWDWNSVLDEWPAAALLRIERTDRGGTTHVKSATTVGKHLVKEWRTNSSISRIR